MGRCEKCHRVLKDPNSVKRGFGPVCWKRAIAAQEAAAQEEEEPGNGARQPAGDADA